MVAQGVLPLFRFVNITCPTMSRAGVWVEGRRGQNQTILHTSPSTRLFACPYSQNNRRRDDGRKARRRKEEPKDQLIPFWPGAVLLPEMGVRL